jgi:EAL and modified HD-GYP domain-containing signal transduction protein
MNAIAALPVAGKGECYRYFALQPMFTSNLAIAAYEALYRHGLQDFFYGDGSLASRLMIDNELLFGYEEITDGLPVFLNGTRETLQSGLLTMLPNWIGIEILESVEPDEVVIRQCQLLKQLGHAISLDDFEEGIHPLETVDRLYDVADFVKIDLRKSNGEIGKRLSTNPNRARIKTVAEKIECEGEFRRALSQGFDLFQGRFLRPPVTYARRINCAGTDRLHILFDHLNLDLFSDHELVEAIQCVPSLEHRLMRRLSWLIDGRNSVSSVHEAIQLLGRSELRRLIALNLSCMEKPAFVQDETPQAGVE